jgi:hypothetical protein
VVRKQPKRPHRPKVILNPDVIDDSDDDVPTLCTPDDDGWVYLKRCAKPKEGKERGKKGRGKT